MKRAVINLARFALGALLAIGVGELVARRFQFAPRVVDPVFGAVFSPGVPVRWATEGDAVSHWSVRGTRGDRPPDPARPRILVLGDSLTEAVQVADHEVFTSQALERLRARGFPHELVNVGKSGASVAHYLALADAYREVFSPVWVVVQIRDSDVGSDVFERRDVEMRRSDRGQFEVTLKKPRTGIVSERVLRPLGRRFALPYFLFTRLEEHRNALAREAPLFSAASSHGSAPGVQDDPIDRYPVAELLEALRSAYADRITLLYLPPFDPARISEPATRTEAFVNDRCRSAGWSCVSLRPAFPDFVVRYESPYGFPNSRWNTGHLNRAGHAAVGALLAEEMEALANRDLL